MHVGLPPPRRPGQIARCEGKGDACADLPIVCDGLTALQVSRQSRQSVCASRRAPHAQALQADNVDAFTHLNTACAQPAHLGG
jgi:hypothetical protein